MPALCKVLLVEDHPVVRRGLTRLINGESDLTVCGEAADSIQALREVERTDPDVVMIDIALRQSNGLELIKQIKARNSKVRMLVSSVHDESVYAERVLRAGALGFVPKDESPEQLLRAIRTVACGKVYLSSGMSDRILGRLVETDDALERSPIEALSDRELEVFQLIGAGETVRAIALALKLSVKTINSHREKIKKKLGMASSSDLIRFAVQWVAENR